MSAISGWNQVRLADVPPAPWRNGGGSTRELLAWPDATAWRVRLSVAEVAQDGPFSCFAGVQRWFAVLSGAGVRLQLDGVAQHLDATSTPFAFDGGAAVDCALVDGPTQDFNLMLRGSRGTMQRVAGEATKALDAPVLIALYAQGAGTTATFGNETVEIGPQTLVWRSLPGGGTVQLAADHALWMEVFP
ncbi:MAG: HutD family protein [Ramlibacter sp.]